MSARVKMYRPGQRLQSITDVVAAIDGQHWLFLSTDGRPKHPAIVGAWPLSMVLNHLRYRGIYLAEKTPEYVASKAKEIAA